MMQPYDAEIESVRSASRRLVRELGFLRGGLAGTTLSPSAVHALLEIEAQDGLTAATLADRLGLEKSSISRLLRKLVGAGLVRESASSRDGRAKPLSLAPAGQSAVAAIHDFARRQVAAALGRLDPAQRRQVAGGLQLYAEALAGAGSPPPITIAEGYHPGVLGHCAAMQARYYAERAGFGLAFESKVAAGLAEFATRLNRPGNQLWRAMRGGAVVGTVAIDGEDLGSGLAHLRWFVVDDSARGAGAGRRLLAAALAFVDAHGVAETQLWTFQGLDAARHLYEAAGFVLDGQWQGAQWGREVTEQRFIRRRPA